MKERGRRKIIEHQEKQTTDTQLLQIIAYLQVTISPHVRFKSADHEACSGELL